MSPSRSLAALLFLLPGAVCAQTGPVATKEHSANEGVPETVPETDPMSLVGHGDKRNDPRYDIWQRNCHNAANTFLWAANGREVGVLVCQGDPTTSPEYHTANWLQTSDGWACIYNWGSRCCWKDGAGNPPTIAGAGYQCAKWACGAQFADFGTAPTRLLPAGEKVEEAGAMACLRASAFGSPSAGPSAAANYSSSKRPECNSCCDERADLWADIRGRHGLRTAAEAQTNTEHREDFRAKCKKACFNFLAGK